MLKGCPTGEAADIGDLTRDLCGRESAMYNNALTMSPVRGSHLPGPRDQNPSEVHRPEMVRSSGRYSGGLRTRRPGPPQLSRGLPWLHVAPLEVSD